MISDEEIVARTLYMMVNEAALILEQAIVQRASDIDVAAVHGVGWPRWRGGPMCWADTIGLDRVVAGLERFSARFAPDFRLSVILKDKARAGQRFLPFEQPPR